jgi:hypothetical protein
MEATYNMDLLSAIVDHNLFKQWNSVLWVYEAFKIVKLLWHLQRKHHKFISDSIIKNSPRSVQLRIIKNCQNVYTTQYSWKPYKPTLHE